MKKINYLHNLVNENHGYLKTSDAVEAGISRSYIMDYVKEYGLERLAQGLYRTEEAWDDGMYVLQTRYPKAVFFMKVPSTCLIWPYGSQFNIPSRYRQVQDQRLLPVKASKSIKSSMNSLKSD